VSSEPKNLLLTANRLQIMGENQIIFLANLFQVNNKYEDRGHAVHAGY